MTAPDGYRLVDLPRERGRETMDIDQWAFAFAVRSAEFESTLDCFPFDRGRGAEIADASRGTVGALASVHSSFGFEMRVPGGATLPTAGLTWVGVHQGHRRRGLLTAMIDDHFTRSLARGESVSTLWAAEPAIYQRFGYGLAARDIRMKIGRKPTLREVPGSDDLTVTLETCDEKKHGPIVRAVQKELMRPGTSTNVPDALLHNLLSDPESEREHAEQLRFITVRDGDHVVAWATFRRKNAFDDWDPSGIVNMPAWGSLNVAASRRLWSVLTDLDLMTSTHCWLIAVDDPLLHLLEDERAAKPYIRDNLWVRVLDVKAALEGRGYEADADVIIELADKQVPANAGKWRVAISGGAAKVAAAPDAKPDLFMNIQELGSTYLGGVGIEALTRAGLVTEHTPGAAHTLGRAMWASIAPVCNTSF